MLPPSALNNLDDDLVSASSSHLSILGLGEHQQQLCGPAGGGGHRGDGGGLSHRAGQRGGNAAEPVGLEHHHPLHPQLRRRAEEGEGPGLLHRRGAQRQEAR